MKNLAPNDATHTNGKSYYLYEEIYEGEKGEWYRWLKTKKIWTEILSKPKGVKAINWSLQND